MLKMTIIAQNWMTIMLLSLFIYILLLQHFGYSHPVLLYSANLSVIVCVRLFFSSCGKAGHNVFGAEREHIFFLKPPLVIRGLGMFGTLKLFLNCYRSKLKGLAGRPWWSIASIYCHSEQVKSRIWQFRSHFYGATKYCTAEIPF